MSWAEFKPQSRALVVAPRIKFLQQEVALQDAKLESVRVDTLEEATASLRQTRPQLLIVDDQPFDMDAICVFRNLAQVPLVLMTSIHSDELLVRLADRTGAVAVLSSYMDRTQAARVLSGAAAERRLIAVPDEAARQRWREHTARVSKVWSMSLAQVLSKEPPLETSEPALNHLVSRIRMKREDAGWEGLSRPESNIELVYVLRDIGLLYFVDRIDGD